MIVHIINQEPLSVGSEEAKKLLQALTAGAEFVVLNGEFVRSNAITGIRNAATDEYHPKVAWGQLPQGVLDHFYDERREAHGPGYAKYQAMKRRLVDGSGE